MSLLILPRRFREQKEPFEVALKATISAKYKVAVCRNGHVVRKPFGDEWIPNVITNVCLDQLMQGMMFYQIVGYGGARVGSGTTTPAVTDTALTTPLKGSSTQFTGGGTGTTISSTADTINGASTHTNVIEFAAESGSVTYNEVGLASTVGPTGGNLYTHSLFPSAVNLVTGDNLRLTYAITFSIPATVTPITVSLSAINGFNMSGQLKVIGLFNYGIFGNLTPSGGYQTGFEGYFRNSLQANAWLCSAPTTFPAINTGLTLTTIGSSVAGTLGTYTAGSFARTQQFIWVPSNPAATSTVVGIVIGQSINLNNGYLYLLLSSSQTKANTNTLTLNTSSSIARA